MGRLKWVIVALFIGVMGGFITARAEEKKTLEVPSTIDRVMVYQERALVTREMSLNNLTPGVYEVMLRDLPVRILDESIRATSLDGANLKVLEVEVKTYQLEKPPEEKIRTLQDQLQKLQDELRVIQDSLKLLQMEKEYLVSSKEHFLKTPAGVKTGEKEETIARVTPKEYGEMLKFFMEKLRANTAALQAEELKQRDMEKKISLVREELTKLGIYQTATYKKSARVSLEALRAGSYKLEVSYLTTGATWQPSYDLRVLSEAKEMEVTGYGVVSQQTGEDWRDVKISFSTAQPALMGWLPELQPLYATLPEAVPSQTYAGRLQREGIMQWSSNEAVLAQQQIELQRSGDKQTTSPEASAYLPSEVVSRLGSVVFHTPKRSDIPADGAPHRTAIFQHKFPVRFEFITCPKTSPHVYLKVLGTNAMDVPLLQGNLNVFMGSDFVCPSFTTGVLPTEDFELTLTVDENIRVSRKLEAKEEKGPGFFGGRKKVTYSFLIKIENYKKENVVLTVIDQIPVSQIKEVTIELGEFSDKPVEEGKDGKLKWRFELKPKETKKITFSFTVYVPKDKDPAFYNLTLPVLQDALKKRELKRK